MTQVNGKRSDLSKLIHDKIKSGEHRLPALCPYSYGSPEYPYSYRLPTCPYSYELSAVDTHLSKLMHDKIKSGEHPLLAFLSLQL